MGVADAGDTVLIHHRPTPYQQKWVLCRQGTATSNIVVRGIPGPNGDLPVLSGSNAATRLQLDYWNENRSLIKVGGASTPPDTMPRHILIENLELRSARPAYTFTNDNGNRIQLHQQRCRHLRGKRGTHYHPQLRPSRLR